MPQLETPPLSIIAPNTNPSLSNPVFSLTLSFTTNMTPLHLPRHPRRAKHQRIHILRDDHIHRPHPLKQQTFRFCLARGIPAAKSKTRGLEDGVGGFPSVVLEKVLRFRLKG